MAKKQTTNETEETRQSRKDVLRAQKQDEQLRVIRIAAIVVGIIIVLVLGIAIVNEFILTPNKSVATVDEQGIALSYWQDRVEYERAQRIMTLESQLESLNGDIGLVQQFSGQTIVELISENAEGLGEAVLDRVVDEEIMRQAAEERDLLPDEGDIEDRIGTTFNYYGGDSPTPFPAPTETIAPTPSLTPIPADGEVAEESLIEPPPLNGPTSTPLPTPTPVSEEAFKGEFEDVLGQFKDLGVGEQTYRSVIANTIIAERLIDTLAIEQELPDDDMHASMYFLAFTDEEEANQTLDEIDEGDFLTIWNSVRSRPVDAEAEDPSTASASEVLWRTRDGIAGSFGDDVAADAFDLPLNAASDLLVVTDAEGEPVYVIIMVSGREIRELAANEFESRKQGLLIALLEEARTENVELNELWRSRVPTSPVLDPKFRQAPTPAPDEGLVVPDGTGLGDEQTVP